MENMEGKWAEIPFYRLPRPLQAILKTNQSLTRIISRKIGLKPRVAVHHNGWGGVSLSEAAELGRFPTRCVPACCWVREVTVGFGAGFRYTARSVFSPEIRGLGSVLRLGHARPIGHWLWGRLGAKRVSQKQVFRFDANTQAIYARLAVWELGSRARFLITEYFDDSFLAELKQAQSR